MTHHVIKNLKRENRRIGKRFPIARKSDRNSKRLKDYDSDDGYMKPTLGDLIANQMEL